MYSFGSKYINFDLFIHTVEDHKYIHVMPLCTFRQLQCFEEYFLKNQNCDYKNEDSDTDLPALMLKDQAI